MGDKEKVTKEKKPQQSGVRRHAAVFFGILTKSFFDLGLLIALAFFVIFLYVYYTSVTPAAMVYRSISETSIIYD